MIETNAQYAAVHRQQFYGEADQCALIKECATLEEAQEVAKAYRAARESRAGNEYLEHNEYCRHTTVLEVASHSESPWEEWDSLPEDAFEAAVRMDPNGEDPDTVSFALEECGYVVVSRHVRGHHLFLNLICREVPGA